MVRLMMYRVGPLSLLEITSIRSPGAADQSPEQPALRQSPVAFDSVSRNMEHFGCLLYTQSTKKPQFDHATLARVGCRQRLQRPIQIEQLRGRRGRHEKRFVERH